MLVACVLLALVPARSALAKPPTAADLEQAKTAFGEGRAKFEEGKFGEAADKFKESYKLSKKPVLLYNIGLALDKNDSKDKALFYYRKFLADAPKEDKNRAEAMKRVEALDKQQLEEELNGKTPNSSGASSSSSSSSGGSSKPADETPKPVKVKPAGTYSATDFQHEMVEIAPPGKHLDVSAFVPEDAGWTVTLYYRGSGDAKFVGKAMRWRYKELVARIPGNKVGGSSIQYYIDAKDAAGATIARSGKSTSPNLINVEAGAPVRNYPDFTEEGETAVTPTQQKKNDLDEDPLSGKKNNQVDDTELDTKREDPTGDPTSPVDSPKNKYSKPKWIATGVAGAFMGAAIVTYMLGSRQASNIVADRDSRKGEDCAGPPCFEFDMYDIDVEKAGERYNTLHTITAVTGVLATGVAAYYWWKERKLKKTRDRQAAKASGGGEFVLTPTFGDGFAGATAAARF